MREFKKIVNRCSQCNVALAGLRVRTIGENGDGSLPIGVNGVAHAHFVLKPIIVVLVLLLLVVPDYLEPLHGGKASELHGAIFEIGNYACLVARKSVDKRGKHQKNDQHIADTMSPPHLVGREKSRARSSPLRCVLAAHNNRWRDFRFRFCNHVVVLRIRQEIVNHENLLEGRAPSTREENKHKKGIRREKRQ